MLELSIVLILLLASFSIAQFSSSDTTDGSIDACIAKNQAYPSSCGPSFKCVCEYWKANPDVPIKIVYGDCGCPGLIAYVKTYEVSCNVYNVNITSAWNTAVENNTNCGGHGIAGGASPFGSSGSRSGGSILSNGGNDMSSGSSSETSAPPSQSSATVSTAPSSRSGGGISGAGQSTPPASTSTSAAPSAHTSSSGGVGSAAGKSQGVRTGSVCYRSIAVVVGLVCGFVSFL